MSKPVNSVKESSSEQKTGDWQEPVDFLPLPKAKREELLNALSENPIEINFFKICKDLGIDFVNGFGPALDRLPDFRAKIVEHIENLKFFIIQSIHDRVTGASKSTVALSHAKFILDLIDSGQILPRLKSIDNKAPVVHTPVDVGRYYAEGLGLDSSIQAEGVTDKLAAADRKKVDEDEEEESQDPAIVEAEKQSTPNWLPDKF